MADETTSEKELLKSAREGNGQALEQLLGHYEPQLFRFAMRMCSDRHDAEDVLQESMLAAARNLEGFRGDSAVSTWLYAITRSFCIKKRRKSRFAPEREEPLDAAAYRVADSTRPPDEHASDRELVRALESVIDTLEPASREVLLLRDVEGLTAPEVASVLEMSVPQVKSRLHRARISVRAQLESLMEGGAVPAPAEGCPDIATLFSRNLEGEISQDLCNEMQSHVDSCQACRSTCDSLKQTLAVCRAIPAPSVPENIQKAVRKLVRERSGAG